MQNNTISELIPIRTNENGIRAVDARTLHQFLGNNTPFSMWIARKINEYGFVENQDFMSFSQNCENGGKRTEYALSLDMAKELAMVERSEKGREARKYFIACEQAAMAVAKLRTELALQDNATQTDMGGLLKEARRMTGVDNRTLAKRCGVSKSTLEKIMYKDKSSRIPEATILGVEAVCRKLVATASLDYDAEGIELLMGVDDTEVRKALFNKMKKGGAI